MHLRYIFRVYVLMTFVLFACEQGQSTAVLEIYVLDPLGNRVQNATVNIYRFKEDWEQEQNAIKPAEITSANGLIRFVNLEAGTYYVDVANGSFNNWEGKIETNVQSVGAFFVNTEFIIINNSKAGEVARAQGKTWKATTIRQLGASTPIDRLEGTFRCRFDNVITFFKGGRYELKKGDGARCSITDAPVVGTGTWKFNETGTIITLQMSGQPTITWIVLEVNKTNIIFQDTTPIGLIRSTDIIFVPN